MNKLIILSICILLAVLIGWLIPIDGPFDIKPEEVIQEYKRTHCCAAPRIIQKRELTEEEIEFLEEEYNLKFFNQE